MRDPYEVGGLQYTMSVLFTFIGTFAAVHIYSQMYVPSSGEEVPLKIDDLYVFVSGVTAVAVVSAAVALRAMKREYWPTFFSTKTGWKQTQSYFLDSEDDETRMDIFTNNLRQWKSIVPEVKAFVLANWEKWGYSKPEWWTEGHKASIPADMIPPAALKEMGPRKDSVIGVRESLRRFSQGQAG